jgi:predicted RNA-binding protein YlxR (DUF448 family)
MKSKMEMLRILKVADGEILIDQTGRQNGRGAYICHNMECFTVARKSKGLERSFKMRIPDDIYENLERELNATGD